jgi:hypothetical protein
MNSRCRGSGILLTNHHTTNQMAVGFWCLASGHPEVIVFQDYSILEVRTISIAAAFDILASAFLGYKTTLFLSCLNLLA